MSQDQRTQATRQNNHVGVFDVPPPGNTPTREPLATDRRSRGALQIAVGIVIALALVGVVIVTRGSTSGLPTPTAAPTSAAALPATSAATASSPAPATPAPSGSGPSGSGPGAAQDLFVDDVRNTPGVQTGLSSGDILAAGTRLCGAIPTVPSHAALIDLLVRAKFGPQVSEAFLTAAEKDLCPQATYGRRAAS